MHNLKKCCCFNNSHKLIHCLNTHMDICDLQKAIKTQLCLIWKFEFWDSFPLMSFGAVQKLELGFLASFFPSTWKQKNVSTVCEPQLTYRFHFFSLLLSSIQPYFNQTSSVQSVTIHWLGVSTALWPWFWLWSLATQLGLVLLASSALPCCFELDNVILQRAGPAARSLH